MCVHNAQLTDSIRQDANNRVYQVVDDLCATVSLYSETKKDEISLFSTVSNLLVALNGKSIAQQLTNLRRHILAQKQTSIPAHTSQMILLPFQQHDQQQVTHALELQVFLLRCAATSKSSKATLVTPVPPSTLWDGGKNDGLTASRILAATNESLLSESQESRSRQAYSTFSPQQRQQLNRGQKELLGFLSVSPWTHQGKIYTNPKTTTRQAAYSLGSTSKIQLHFDISEAIGDDSPRFAELSETCGITTAYHGTNIEAIWSILHYGLLNLSDTRLCQNGAMLGSGIYVSPSLQVAEFFAQSATLHPSVFWHWYQNHLVAQTQDADTHVSWLGNLPLKALDKYNVSCRAVVQARLILPPSSPASNGETITKSANGSEANGDSQYSAWTRRDGKYFVVPNNQDIRVTGLHLTFEFEPKRSNQVLLAVIVCLGIFLAFFR